MKTQLTIKVLTLFAILQGCGTDENGKANNAEADRLKEESDRKGIAIVVNSDLPECSESLEGTLVYQKSSKQFFYCDNSSWIEIDIKGEKGDSGDDGIAGDKGDQGEEATPLPANVWYDPIAKKHWLIGSVHTYEQYTAACVSPYRRATQAETETAILHGLTSEVQSINGSTRIWFDSTPTTTVDNVTVYKSMFTDLTTRYETAPPYKQGIACIK